MQRRAPPVSGVFHGGAPTRIVEENAAGVIDIADAARRGATLQQQAGEQTACRRGVGLACHHLGRESQCVEKRRRLSQRPAAAKLTR